MWQPIETMPQGVEVFVFSHEHARPWGGVRMALIHFADTTPRQVIGLGSDGEQYGWAPSHWMPIPDAPEL